MRTHGTLVTVLALLVAVVPLCAQTTGVYALFPYPKAAFARASDFGAYVGTQIVVPADADSTTMRAARYVQRAFAERFPVGALRIVTPNAFDRAAGPAIMIGVKDSYPELMTRMAARMPGGEEYPPEEGYVLDVDANGVVLVGTDASGVFNGATTLVQLMGPGDASVRIGGAHVRDYPDYPIRWAFSQHNLRGTGAITNLKRIIDTMAYYKLNGIQQNDFKYNILESQPAYYFDSVRAFRAAADAGNVEIIPGTANIGYSEGILWHDPNLAEGLPAHALYVVEADTGRIIPDPRVTLPNGSFESIGGNGRFTGWSFYDDAAVPDHTVAHGGSASARCTNFTQGNPSGNCRFNRKVDCQPYRVYVMSAWVRTQNFRADEVRLLALGVDGGNNTHALTFTAFNIPATTPGWTRVEVTFNTLAYSSVLLYCGVWGGQAGTIWWDDFEIRDAGLTNVLRRGGTPLGVRHAAGGAVLSEELDYLPVVDSVMLRSNGSYGPYHAPPMFRRRANGAIHNGDTLSVSYYHPVTTVADQNGIGQVMVCVSEPALYTVLRTQMQGVADLYAPKSILLGHDEIRVMNHDSACRRRNLSPAALLADNLTQCNNIAHAVAPDARTFVWSDMFDSLHNAVPDYYLVDGDLTGSWETIPRTIGIVNWNFGRRDASLQAFSQKGFRQIAAPYYDTRSTENIREWRRSIDNAPGTLGMMYTTWSGDYDFLKPFAYYAWGTGPYVIFEPLDSAAILKDSVCFRATVLPDPYDPTDSIELVAMGLQRDDLSDPADDPIPQYLELVRESGNVFVGCTPLGLGPNYELRYQIAARDAHGRVRQSGTYRITRAAAGVPHSATAHTAAIAMHTVPAVASASTTLRFTLPASGRWAVSVVDLLGRTVRQFEGEDAAGECRTTIDVASLPTGVYHCVLRSGTAAGTTAIHVVR